MSLENKILLDKLIQYYGGSYTRISKRLFWNAPDGKAYHVTTIFLRRMMLNHKKKGIVNDQPKQEDSLNGRTEQSQPRSEEVTAPIAKVRTEENKESSKKKKDRPKKTIPKVEDEKKQGEEVITSEEKDENI